MITSSYVSTNLFRYSGVNKTFAHNAFIAIWRSFKKILNIGSNVNKIGAALEKNKVRIVVNNI